MDTLHEKEQEAEHLTPENVYSERMARIRELLAAGDKATLLAEFADAHEADIAEIVTLLPPESRVRFVQLLWNDMPAEILAELDDGVREEIIEQIDSPTLARSLRQLDSDDAVFVLEDLQQDERDKVLNLMPQSDRLVLERSLEYPEDSAGRIMQSKFVSVPPFWTVGQTIDYLRDTDDLPPQFLEVFITDPAFKPVGVVHLSKILRTQRSATMQQLVHEDFPILQTTTDREDVARMFERYNLVSAAVVDGDQRLVGVITADDVFEVIQEEASEDILRLAGVGDEAVTDSVMEVARGRGSWLFVNLLTAILASVVIGFFDASIERMVALAVLMPIVASMGGNAATQTLAITVRSLATQDILAANAWRVIIRELGVGAVNGVAFALIAGIIGALWFDDAALGLVLAGAMIVNLVVASLAGILIPMGLQARHIDPAIASSVFVTTVTDVVGFLAFLGFATIFLL